MSDGETTPPASGGTPTKIDVETPISSQRFLRPILIASQKTGRSPLAITAEWLSFHLGTPKLQADEYFKYALFDSKRYTPAEKQQFVGSVRTRKMNMEANQAAKFAGLIDNKLYLEATLRGYGFRTVHTLAVFGDPTRFGGVSSFRVLTAIDEVRAFLREQDRPVFGKPLAASQSLGTIGIERLADDGDTLELSNGTTMSLETLCSQVRNNYWGSGYTFQRKLTVHPDLVRYPGTAVGTFRIVTVVTPEGVRPLYSAWKIPSPTSMADNFWRSDNLIASIDLESGRIVRCQKGTGVDATEIEILPGTEVRIVGETVPMWSELVGLAVGVARLFTDVRVIGFDIALTPDGPTIVEGNTNPDHGLYQIATGRGFLNPEWAAWMKLAGEAAKEAAEKEKLAARDRRKAYHRRKRGKALSDLKTDLQAPVDAPKKP